MKIEKEEMLFMKKSIKTTLLGSAAVLMSVSLAACGNSSASKSTKKTTAPKTEKVQKKSSASSATSAAESSAVSSSASSEASSMSSASSSSTVSAQNLTPQQMGILLAMDQEPDILGGSDGSALPLWYGVVNNNDGSSDDTVGYNYFTTHGDGTADIYWKINGNMVTFKRLDPNSGDCVADEKMMTKTIPVSELIQKYYSTPQQQSQVNNAANQMQPQNN
ncbi:Lreu_0056 family protein [Ligilactobacillus aviarius]|uniref:Lreu_0056 family protein n=2 Tax=Ligilactobacillus aviarius TaxID=1606 RepID=UPI00242F2B3D|nr:hypothetical protein [Ligilactobacillus aviarius]